MIGAISNALQGLTGAAKTVEKTAENIAGLSARPETDTVNLSEEAVRLKLAEHAYRANVATLKTADDMSDELMRLFDEKV